MNSRIFIHVALMLVLGASQLAANMHLIGHFQIHEDKVNTTFAPCEFTGVPSSAFNGAPEHVNHQHNNLHTEHTGSIYANPGIDNDCAIYHAYLGLNACVSDVMLVFTVPPRNIVLSPTSVKHIATQVVSGLPIRGPPKFS